MGLANLGNTCFLNACLQVLNHVYELHEILDSDKCKYILKTDLPDSRIIQEWNELRKIMWSNPAGVISPNKFVHNIQLLARKKNRDIFTGWAQNDISEFLLFMMDCIHNSISRTVKIQISGNPDNSVDKLAIECYTTLKRAYEKEYSEILDLFYGIYVSEIRNMEDGGEGGKIYSIKPEQYFILDLPIVDGHNQPITDIGRALSEFTRNEVLYGDNEWLNEKTGRKEPVKKRMIFWNFPKILIISLKRFSSNGQYKLTHCVDFPLNDWDISNFVQGYNKSSFVYDLIGVCNHIGGVTGGHYTAFAKKMATNEWFHYNDTHVHAVNQLSEIVSPVAYTLFYRKKNNLL